MAPIKQTMSKEITRQTILNKGAMLVHSQGFVNTGIQDILDAAGVPKGSFYFYFKSKEDFGTALVDHFGAFISSIFNKHLKDTSRPPMERFSGLIDNYIQIFTNLQCTHGCPIGNLSLEMSDLSDPIRAKLLEVYIKMRSDIRDCLLEAREADEIDNTMDLESLAIFILNSWEGALLDMKLSKSITPLVIFKNIMTGFFTKNKN
jgi:TetR/AcrR family transcriptional regulator, transcriptional repressor for nem operon